MAQLQGAFGKGGRGSARRNVANRSDYVTGSVEFPHLVPRRTASAARTFSAPSAPVWTNGIGKQRQSFKIQIVLADALVGFACASRAKNNFADDVPQVIQTDRQAAFHGYEINHVHDGVDLRQAFSSHHAPQQRFRRTAVARRIFSQRLVRFARRFHLRRFQHAAWERQSLNFVFPGLHFLKQRGGRRACFHARRHARERGPRAFRFQFRIHCYLHGIINRGSASASLRSASGISSALLFRTQGSAPVSAKRPESLPRRTRCGSACTLAAESPAAPDPSSRARRTSAFQSPRSESPLPDKAHSPAPHRETAPAKYAAEMRAHRCKWHVPPAAARWEPLRSKSAGLSPVAPACRRWCREIRRCSPCRLSSRTWCSHRHAKTSLGQSRAEFFSRSPARAI